MYVCIEKEILDVMCIQRYIKTRVVIHMLLPSAEPLVKEADVRRLQSNDTVLTASLERETAQEWNQGKGHGSEGK